MKVSKKHVLYVGQKNQALNPIRASLEIVSKFNFDMGTDVLKQKINKIRNLVINPSPILIVSIDDNTAFKLMSIVAHKSWVDLVEEQIQPPSTTMFET